MTTVKHYETFWEDDEGKETKLSVNYTYYPPVKGGRNSYGVPMEPDEGAEISILNIRTEHGQDPMIAVQDWDREYAVHVLERRIMEEYENE